MSNLLNSTLTLMTVDDAIFEHDAIERGHSPFNEDAFTVCGDTLAILKHRLLINAYGL